MTRLAIGRGGWLRGARRLRSPNQDARPPGIPVSLVVVHGISLPPGEFGGGAIDPQAMVEVLRKVDHACDAPSPPRPDPLAPARPGVALASCQRRW